MMNSFTTVYQTRQAIDNRLNRDLIAQAREQGFVFSNPIADARLWQLLQTANLENLDSLCSLNEREWLSVRAFEATLFLIYQQRRH